MAKQKNDNGKSNGGNQSNNGGGKTRSNDKDSATKDKERRDIKAARRKGLGGGSKNQTPKTTSGSPREAAVTEQDLVYLRSKLAERLRTGTEKLAERRGLSLPALTLLEFVSKRLVAAETTQCDPGSIIEAYQAHRLGLGEELVPDGQLKSFRKAIRDLQMVFVDECRRLKVRNSEMPVIKQKWFRDLRSEMAQATEAAKKSTTKDNGTTPQVKTQPEPAAQAA